MQACEIRRMNLDDLDAVVAIEAATFPTPWSRHSFEQELTRNVAARYLVAALDGQVIGYAGAWIILDESHITNIAIAEAFRGNGYGRAAHAGLASVSVQPGGILCHPGSAQKQPARAEPVYQPGLSIRWAGESGIMRIIRRMPC